MKDIARHVSALADTWNTLQEAKVALEDSLHPVIHEWSDFVKEYSDTLPGKFGPGVAFYNGSSFSRTHYPKWPGAHKGSDVVYELDLEASTLTHLSFVATWYEHGDDNYHHLILPVAFITDRGVFTKMQVELWDKEFAAGVEKHRAEQEAKDLQAYEDLRVKLEKAGKNLGK